MTENAHKDRIAKVGQSKNGAPHIARNFHRTYLMFEKLYFGIFLHFKNEESTIYAGMGTRHRSIH